MKVIDAIWEKRNLGVSCYEIHLETNDSFDQVVSDYMNLEEKQYMVVKVPAARYDFVQYFQRNAYQFVETALTLKCNINKITIPRRLQQICDKCSWTIMDTNDLERLYREIENGIFKTDRIYIDPEFTKQQAARRYIYWIQDLVKQGNVPYKVVYANELVGFFLNKERGDGIYDGILAATYSDFEGTGMGYCIQYAGLQWVIECGAKEYVGHISGNNPKVMRILLSLGFSIEKMEYIFVKHNGKGE